MNRTCGLRDKSLERSLGAAYETADIKREATTLGGRVEASRSAAGEVELLAPPLRHLRCGRAYDDEPFRSEARSAGAEVFVVKGALVGSVVEIVRGTI